MAKYGKKLTTPIGARSKSKYPSPASKATPNPLNKTPRGGKPKTTMQGARRK